MEIDSVNERFECSSLFGLKLDNIDKMSSPSDFFGKEILPGYTVESEYGTLEFKPIIVPDFSNDQEEFENFKLCFDDIKKFITEKDLLEKGDSAFFMKKHISWLPIDYGYSKIYDFARGLDTSFCCRLFETGVSKGYSICSLFAPCDYPGWRYIQDTLSYNELVVTEALSYGTGVFIQSLGIYMGKVSHSRAHTPEIVDEVFRHIPTHNYLSWAFHCASSNCPLINSCSKTIVRLFT